MGTPVFVHYFVTSEDMVHPFILLFGQCFVAKDLIEQSLTIIEQSLLVNTAGSHVILL